MLEQARIKLLRHVLADRGAPTDDGVRRLVGAEWSAARRLADRFQASAVIVGHSRAMVWRSEATLTTVDTGTWTWLIDPPPPGSGDAVWRLTLAAGPAERRPRPADAGSRTVNSSEIAGAPASRTR